MKAAAWLLLASLHVYFAAGSVTEGPWLSNSERVPRQGLRITTLGSGTPDVRKDQVSSGFLLELGNGDKFIWDLGTGSYQNLLATAVPAAQLTKVHVPQCSNQTQALKHATLSLDIQPQECLTTFYAVTHDIVPIVLT